MNGWFTQKHWEMHNTRAEMAWCWNTLTVRHGTEVILSSRLWLRRRGLVRRGEIPQRDNTTACFQAKGGCCETKHWLWQTRLWSRSQHWYDARGLTPLTVRTDSVTEMFFVHLLFCHTFARNDFPQKHLIQSLLCEPQSLRFQWGTYHTLAFLQLCGKEPSLNLTLRR